LRRGAELESKDIEGRTPLWWAAENEHEAVVKLLLKKGAELESKDKHYSRTPPWWAAGNGHEAVVLPRLLVTFVLCLPHLLLPLLNLYITYIPHVMANFAVISGTNVSVGDH
jgi:hypothetical protein